MTERSKLTLDVLEQLLAELGGRIENNRKEAAQLASAVKQVEAVIRMLDPTFNVRRITARRRDKSKAPLKRGHRFKTIADVLRDSAEPLTTRQIAETILRQAGDPEPPIRVIREMVPSIHLSLRRHQGTSVEAVGEGVPVRWRLRDIGNP
jgi:hypothetical protein